MNRYKQAAHDRKAQVEDAQTPSMSNSSIEITPDMYGPGGAPPASRSQIGRWPEVLITD